jgi:LysM repeat protein
MRNVLANTAFEYAEYRGGLTGKTPDFLPDNPRTRRAMIALAQPLYAAGGFGLFRKALLGSLGGAKVILVPSMGAFTASSVAAAWFGIQEARGIRTDPDWTRMSKLVTNASLLVGFGDVTAQALYSLLVGSHNTPSNRARAGMTTPSITLPPVTTPSSLPPATTPATTPPGAITTPQGPSLPPGPPATQVVVTATTGVFERAGPSSSERILGAVRVGALLKETGQVENGYAQVVLGKDASGQDIVGWVAARAVSPHPLGSVNATGRNDYALESKGYRGVTVEPGDTLASIAARNHVSLSQTIALNAAHIANPDVLYAGDTIYLPMAALQTAGVS